MSYNYTNGDGVAVLLVTEPDGDTEPVANLDDAIIQIKKYLNDPTAGPDAKIAAITSVVSPIGKIDMFGMTSLPSGWLLCDGTAVSRTTYAALFAIIGTVWGAGNGTTTFNLPRLSGRSPVATGTSNAVDATAVSIAQEKGAETHTLDIAEIPAHTHDQTIYGNLAGTAGANPIWANTGSAATSSAGGGGAHNNLPPIIGVVFAIKT
jgi:microcystin-dependent protein